MSTTKHAHPKSQHRATREQWTITEAKLNYSTTSCLIELRDRIKLLEAAQHAHPITKPTDERFDVALICAYARNFIEEYGSHKEADELERIIAALSRRLALDV